MLKLELKTDPPGLAKLGLSPRVSANFRVNYSNFDTAFVKEMLQRDKVILEQRIKKTHFAATSEFGEAVMAQILQVPDKQEEVIDTLKVAKIPKKRGRKKKKYNAQAPSSSVSL